MSESLLELVEMPNGDVALKRVDAEGDQPEPVVTIRFSKSSLVLMQESKMLIAQAMIEAGMNAYSELIDETVIEEANASEVIFH